MKKVLVIYYSQSGQLGEILQSFISPMLKAGHQVETVKVRPADEYPFPWKGNSFFAVMPDCVLGVPGKLKEFELKEKKYDLVVLGYQAWFLSPSIPVNTLLQDEHIRSILKNTPVVTVTGARNMWISAMERLKTSLREIDANLVGNIALVDRHPNLISFITIFYWMLTGKKEKFLNIFPTPGVAEEDIRRCAEYGMIVNEHLTQQRWSGLQDQLVSKGAVVIKYNLMFIESKARKIFRIWAGIISRKKNKTIWLNAFKYYLMIALFIAAPVILTVDAILFKPFLGKRIRRQKLQYAGVN
jgi:hypothetical protein